jgi:hypothetical protein
MANPTAATMSYRLVSAEISGPVPKHRVRVPSTGTFGGTPSTDFGRRYESGFA